MIAAISWVPKGVSKSVPAVAEAPSKEEIEEILNSVAFERSEGSENEDHDEDMDVDAAKQGDEVAHALVAADALGKASKSTTSKTNFQDITDCLQELDMEHYDEEDDGVELFSVGLGETYYPSNDVDPYLKDNDDDDSEEVEDMTIKAEDVVIVCARNEDDVSHLELFPSAQHGLIAQLKVEKKVQAIAWNHHVPQVLLSGSFDHTVVMKDGRVPSHTGFKWLVSGDVETVAWDPHTALIVVSLEDGTVDGFDIRAVKSDQCSDSKLSFTLHAHDKAVCTVSYNPSAPNLLATGSTDGKIVGSVKQPTIMCCF